MWAAIPSTALTGNGVAMGLSLVQVVTEGVKEEELKDLERVIEKAKEMYGIEKVCTGAIESVYQAERIQIFLG